MKNLLSLSIVAMTILSLFGCKETQANAPAPKELNLQLYSVRTLLGTPELFAQNHTEVLKSIHDMGFTGVEAASYDDGNFFYAGDDPMEAFAQFRDRIAHVHLKDRFKMADGASPALGVGIVPCRQILDQLVSTGYDGWFCIEGYGAKDMKEHLKISVENMTK